VAVGLIQQSPLGPKALGAEACGLCFCAASARCFRRADAHGAGMPSSCIRSAEGFYGGVLPLRRTYPESFADHV